jgi:hypothetical protein
LKDEEKRCSCHEPGIKYLFVVLVFFFEHKQHVLRGKRGWQRLDTLGCIRQGMLDSAGTTT